MSATISPRPGSSAGGANGDAPDARPVLLHKIEGHVARVNDLVLLSKEEGVWTISDDRSVRLYLQRENGQFWPSIHHLMPVAPTKIHYCEETSKLLIGVLNGAVFEYQVASDLNSMTEKRVWNVHTAPVTGVRLALAAELIVSCARDRLFVWHCADSSVKLGQYACGAACSAMEFDAPFAFIGDAGGAVTLLRLNGTQATLVSTLSAHTNSITSLAWDASRQWLFSGSADNLVIVWDIGGKKGQAYELNGHASRVNCLALAGAAKRLCSADESGNLVCWDLTAKRLETPQWKNSDNCQLCDVPFFWNLRAQWNLKVVGQRQHHCRTCGAAVCGACCSHVTKYPPMGFELPVRICKACKARIDQFPEQFDMTPLATISELRVGVTSMCVEELRGRMATVGYNRVIMLWDTRPLFATPPPPPAQPGPSSSVRR